MPWGSELLGPKRAIVSNQGWPLVFRCDLISENPFPARLSEGYLWYGGESNEIVGWGWDEWDGPRPGETRYINLVYNMGFAIAIALGSGIGAEWILRRRRAKQMREG